MISKFLSRNGETYRVLAEDKDTCWVISYNNPMNRPFCITALELDSFLHVPAPRNFAPEECNLSLAAQKRLALTQPLLGRDMDAVQTGSSGFLSQRTSPSDRILPPVGS